MPFYTRVVPLTSQSLGVTQPMVLGNFEQIWDVFLKNHRDYNQTDAGKHFLLSMPNQGSTDLAVDAGDLGFYVKLVNTFPQLFVRNQGNGSVYQLTSLDDSEISKFGTFTALTIGTGSGTGGWTYLPGNLLVNYGRFSGATTPVTITFPKAYPAATSPFVIGGNPSGSPGNTTFVSIATTGTFIAIGPAT